MIVVTQWNHVVPPPMTGNYMPSGPDIEVDYTQFTYGPKQTQPSESESQSTCQPKVWSDAPIIKEYESDSEDEYVCLPTKQQETPSFANQQVKTPRETVKNQFTHSQKPKVDKKELGYGFTVRACFVCRSLNHLIRDCDFHEKRMARKAELTNGWNRKSSQREIRQTWNNVQRVNKQNQFVPTAVLTRTGKIPVNIAGASSTKIFSTARQSFNRQTVLTSTAMKVNTFKPKGILKEKDESALRHCFVYFPIWSSYSSISLLILKTDAKMRRVQERKFTFWEEGYCTNWVLSNKRMKEELLVRNISKVGCSWDIWQEEVHGLYSLSNGCEKFPSFMAMDEEGYTSIQSLVLIGYFNVLTASRTSWLFTIEAEYVACYKLLWASFVASTYVRLWFNFMNIKITLIMNGTSALCCISRGSLGFRESLRRAFDGTEALLLPTLFILWLATLVSTVQVSTARQSFVPALESLKQIPQGVLQSKVRWRIGVIHPNDKSPVGFDQAKDITILKAHIKKLKKQAKPVVKHYRAWMKSVSLKQRLARKRSSKKQWVHRESVSKQGRKFAKDVGRTREVVDKEKENDEDALSTEDVLSTAQQRVSTDKEKVSTNRTIVSTAGSKVSTDRQKDSTDEQNEAKAVSREKEKGVEFKDIEETDRPRPTSTRSLLTLASDEEMARKVQEEWEGEEERKRLAEEEATNEALIRNYDDIKARIEAENCCSKEFFAQQRSEAIRTVHSSKNQLRNQKDDLLNPGSSTHLALTGEELASQDQTVLVIIFCDICGYLTLCRTLTCSLAEPLVSEDEDISEGVIPWVIVLEYDRTPDAASMPHQHQLHTMPQEDPQTRQFHRTRRGAEPFTSLLIHLPLSHSDKLTESDPEEDPEEYEDDETEDGSVDYPMDGEDDGDDDDGDSSGDDADGEDEDDEEEEEHLAPADSAICTITVRPQTSISLPQEQRMERLSAMTTPSPSPPISLSPPSAGERLVRSMAPPAHSSPPPVPSPLLPLSMCPPKFRTPG
ncbi:hypothetical protein Tco_0031666 [Tanacetum coccineum]